MEEKMYTTKKCDGNPHKLIEIYEVGSEMYSKVIRWCEKCGAIVIDVDYDGRTNPGAFMPMRFPKDSYKR